jgi:hypothetical protein
MDIVRTHPMVILGGILQQNPFFVPPDDLLVEIRQRSPSKPAHLRVAADPCISDLKANENEVLRRSLRDLLALSTLPAAWVGRAPQDVAQGVTSAVMSALRADCVYLRIAKGANPVEIWRGNASGELLKMLRLKSCATRSTTTVLHERCEAFRTVMVPLGYLSDFGTLAVISTRSDFPTALEQMLLTVAANQAAICLDSARIVHELTRAIEEKDRSHWYIRKLHDVLPFCISCKKVKTTDASWETVEQFLHKHSEFLSHGYCPECLARWREENTSELDESALGEKVPGRAGA